MFVGAAVGERPARARCRRAGAADAPDDASLVDAIAEERRDAEDRVAQSEAVQHWLLAALDESSDAIVVVDRIGREVVRNAVARRFAGARTGEVLAEEAISELVQDALTGHSSERELQLYGPPRQVLQLRAFPLRRDGEIVGAVGVHPRHLGVAAGRERAARLRRQRESRAEDADRRARPARRDDGRDRRRRR